MDLFPTVPDLIRLIALNIDDSSDWYSLVTVNRLIYHSTLPLVPLKRKELENHLWKLITLFPEKSWDSHRVSVNPNTTRKILEKFISRKRGETLREKAWRWFRSFLYSEPEDVLNGRSIQGNRHLTLEEILALPFLLDWEVISFNPSLTPEELLSRSEFRELWAWAWRISTNPTLTLEEVLNYNDESWDWFEVSRAPNITWEIIKSNPSIRWDISGISCNPNITMEIISSNLKFPWDWRYVSRNPNLTWDFIETHPELAEEWDWTQVSGHSSITWEIISSHPHLPQEGKPIPWNRHSISQNPNITWEIIRDHLSSHSDTSDTSFWCWECFSRNPNVTWELVRDHPEIEWRWSILSENTFGKH